MKKISFRKYTIFIVSIFMMSVFVLTAVSYKSSTVYAAPAKTQENANTKKEKRPTYTETLETNNKQLKQLKEYLDKSNAKPKWYEYKFKEQDFIKKSGDAGASLVKIVAAVAKENQDFNYGTEVYNMAKSLITGALSGTVYGAAAEAAFAIFDAINSAVASGDKPLSEVQIMQDKMLQEFEKMSSDIHQIQDEVSLLSTKLSKSVESILDGTESVVAASDSKKRIERFYSRSEGNFSFTEFKNYLYGSSDYSKNRYSSKAYYNQYLDSKLENKPTELIENYLNKLFVSISSNLDIYEDYIMGNKQAGIKPIVQEYYDFLCSNQQLTTASSPEYLAIEFASDVYKTQAYAHELLALCYDHMINVLRLEAAYEGINVDDENDNRLLAKEYNYSKNESLTYDEIYNRLNETIFNSSLDEYVIDDLSYILGLDNSYVISYKEGENEVLHSLYTNKENGKAYINIIPDSKVYLNLLDNDILSMFGLYEEDFNYYFGDESVSKADFGVIDLSKNVSNKTASVYYKDKVVYSVIINGKDSSNMSGQGTKSDPYLITNEEQFLKMIDAINDTTEKDNAYESYRLVADINFENEIITPIGTEKNPFNGTFDGNGHTIRNLKVVNPSRSSDELGVSTTGLFGTIGYSGEVKNLTIKNYQVVSNYKEDHIEPTDDAQFFIGGIAGNNYGRLINTTLTCDKYESFTIDVNRVKDDRNSRSLTVIVGGICGNNEGFISNCTVEGLNMNIFTDHNSYGETNTSANRQIIFAGGCVGRNWESLEFVRIQNSSILIKATAKSSIQDKTFRPEMIIKYAGLIGDAESTQFENCYADVEMDYELKLENNASFSLLERYKSKYSFQNVTIESGTYCANHTALRSGNEWNEFEWEKFSRDKDVLDYQYDYIAEINRYNELLITHAALKTTNPTLYATYIDQFIYDKIKYPNTTNFVDYVVASVTGRPVQVLSIFKDDVRAYLKDKFKKIDDESYVENIKSFEASHISEIKKDYIIIIKYLDENGNEITDDNYKESYLPGSSYDWKTKKFYIKWNNEDTETKLEVSAVLAYGFSSYKSVNDFNTTNQTVELLILAKYNDEEYILKCNQDIQILGNQVTNVEVSGFITSEFDKGNGTEEEIKSMRDAILSHPFTVKFTYLTGGSSSIVINSSFDSILEIYGLTNEYFGTRNITLYINELNLTIDAQIVISCDHEYGPEETILGNCENYTYEQRTCSKCGNEYKYNYRLGQHQFIYENTPVTCKNAGLLKSVKCAVCDKVFEKGEIVQAIGHNFVEIPNEELGKGYDSKYYHWCSNNGCGEFELHDYKVTEGSFEDKVFYTYECVECHHKEVIIDENINSNNNETIIYVTDGYYIHNKDKVTVYVQLVNPVNFTSALFGIRYSEGLKLSSYKVGNEIPNKIKEAQQVTNGINFVWADVKEHNIESYLLKLVFEVEDYQKDYTVDVVYGIDNFAGNNTQQGFMVNGKKIQFITRAGIISRVNQLPGDVNKDGKVNLFDAQLLAWKEIDKIIPPTDPEDLESYPYDFSFKNADINLDGDIDIQDITELLQAIYGYNGVSLKKNDYKLYLNLNGYVNESIPESIDISFYLDDDTRATWADVENENFSLDSITNLEREGYTFMGWYTRLVGGENVSLDRNALISYDNDQKKQTLYARWELNKIKLIIDGDEEIISYRPNDLTQSENENVKIEVTEHNTVKEYMITFEIWKNASLTADTSKDAIATSTLIGWKDGDALISLTDTYNLVTPNTQIILTAVWSEYTLTVPTFDKVNHYDEVSGFVYSDNGSEFSTSDERVQRGESFKVKHVLVPTKYQIVFEKNIDENTDNIKFDNDNSINIDTANYVFTIESQAIEITNLKDIDHYTFLGWRLFGKTAITQKVEISTSNFAEYLSDSKIIITANWKPRVYTITFKGMNNSYEDYDLKTLYYPYGGDSLYDTDSCSKTVKFNSSEVNNVSTYSSFLSNFTFGGFYLNKVTNNGKPGASSSVQIINPDGNFAITKGKSYFNGDRVLYAKYTPKEITLSITPNSRGLVETTVISNAMGLVDYNTSGNNLSLQYTAYNNTYTLKNKSTNDPYCTTNEYMVLKANTTYYMHLEASGNIQVFFGLNGNYNETNSLKFNSSTKTKTFTVSEDGRYLIRFDNDSTSNISVKNFYVDTYEWNLSVKYTFGQKLTITRTPSSKYYKVGFGDLTLKESSNANQYYLDNCQLTSGTVLNLVWSEKKYNDYNYVSNLSEFKQMMNKFDSGEKANYMLVHDIDCNGDSITPAKQLVIGANLDGSYHQVYNFEINVNKEGNDIDNRVGLFCTNAGSISNLIIGKKDSTKNTIKLSYKNAVDGSATGSNEYIRNYVGAIAGYNKGAISNCTVQYMNIIGQANSRHGGVSGKSTIVIVVVGGAIGHNESPSVQKITIRGCHITSDAISKYDGQYSVATGGGVMGSNMVNYSHSITYMSVIDSYISVEAHTQCDQSYNRAYDAITNAGLVAGIITSYTNFGTITNINNSVHSSATDVVNYDHGYERRQGTYYGFVGTEEDHSNSGTQVV